MRIQCQSCQAKYKIADEKIGKKVFQLRCKQCSATIVIDGSAVPSDESATKNAPVPRTPEPSEAPPSTSAARRDGGRGRGADLFGNAAKAGSEEEEVAKKTATTPAPTTEAKPAEGPKLTGTRSEDSVLFSVPGSGGKLAPSSPPSSSSSALLDIRSLSLDKDADDSGPTNESSIDDIMNLSGGGAFGSALAAPVLGLPASESSSIAPAGEAKSSKTLVPAILGGAALIAVAIVVAVLMTRPPAAQPVGTASTATMTGLATAPTSSVAASDPTSTTGANAPPTPKAGEASAKVAGLLPPDRSVRPMGAAATAAAASGATADTQPDETAPASAAPPTPAPAPTPDKPADLASALANAAGRTDEKPPENAAGGGSAAQFDRGAAAAALGGIDIQGCKKPDGPTGAGHVNVTFAPDGSVASAIVDQGPFPSTPVGGCIAGKFRGAHVPPFSGAAVRVGKSFTLN